MGLLTKYGFSRPVSNEPWHLQSAGTAASLSASGIYSADSPMSQGGYSMETGPKSTKSVSESAAAPEPLLKKADAVQSSDTNFSRAAPSRADTGKISTESVPKFSFLDSGFFMLNMRALN